MTTDLLMKTVGVYIPRREAKTPVALGHSIYRDLTREGGVIG